VFGGREYRSSEVVVMFSPRLPGEREKVGCLEEGFWRVWKRDASRMETWRGFEEEGVGEQWMSDWTPWFWRR
jgi:hypothetical protein